VLEHHRLAACALCLEDLATSENWRLATQEDVQQASIGLACAKWYQAFHRAGRDELRKYPRIFDVLSWEYDALNEEALHRAEKFFSLDRVEGWQQACEMSGQIVAYLRPQIDTITYNDFFYVNLAVSRRSPAEITMFDFDHSGKGFAESDYSNVASGLQGDALASFRSTMPVDQERLALDELLSILHGLVVASRRARTPTWCLQLVESIKTQEFASKLETVMKFL
jgi:Ser/Thr protein kinase RdoA (MazF antagonist)